MPQVVLRPHAKRDLASVLIYIGEVLGLPQAAKKFYEDFWYEMELGQENPGMGVRFQEPMLENTGYRWVMVGKYRVFYRCDREMVTVWRVIHCSQDIDEFELIDWLE